MRDNNMNNLIGLQSREEVQHALQDSYSHQDLFGEYIRVVITRAPVGYIFINIILVIWIAQTVFSSHLNAIPNSIYLLSPLLAANPFSHLALLPLSQTCPPGQQPLPLKSLPTIYSDHINHQQIYGWDTEPVQFCAKQIPKQKKGSNCGSGEVLCSGYCVKTSNDCPITKLKVEIKDIPLESGYEEIYQSTEGKSYRISRIDDIPIVAIKAAYETKCANDEHYNEAFNDETQFWNKSEDCGKEGTISEFFHPIDRMETNSFFSINNIGITTTNSSMLQVTLGTVPEFHLSSDSNKGCEQASQQTQSVKQYFLAAAPAPQFSGILTGFSFVLLIASILWLLAYYYIPQWKDTMYIVTLGISIIEEVIVGFIYSNNVELFRLEKVTQTLRNCLEEQVPALKQWDFGMESPSAFEMLLFVNTIYLGIHISALLYNHFCMQEYKRQPALLPLPNNNNLNNNLAF